MTKQIDTDAKIITKWAKKIDEAHFAYAYSRVEFEDIYEEELTNMVISEGNLVCEFITEDLVHVDVYRLIYDDMDLLVFCGSGLDGDTTIQFYKTGGVFQYHQLRGGKFYNHSWTNCWYTGASFARRDALDHAINCAENAEDFYEFANQEK